MTKSPTVLKMFWPKYFDQKAGRWIPVTSRVQFSMSDLKNSCALCGWGKHMAIHQSVGPINALGQHEWVNPANSKSITS